VPNRVDEERENIRNHRNKQHEFRKFLPAPSSLEVLASKPDDGGGNRQGDDVVLNQRTGQESPWELDGLCWDQDQVRDCP